MSSPLPPSPFLVLVPGCPGCPPNQIVTVTVQFGGVNPDWACLSTARCVGQIIAILRRVIKPMRHIFQPSVRTYCLGWWQEEALVLKKPSPKKSLISEDAAAPEMTLIDHRDSDVYIHLHLCWCTYFSVYVWGSKWKLLKLKLLSGAISSVIRVPCCLIAYKVLMNGADGIFTVAL